MRPIFGIALLLLGYCNLFAQSSIPVQTISVGMLSPEAASLGKFGNIPVGYQTGVPDISIPVYRIKIGKIDLPLSLDYHAGGIRVDELPSSVGLGWALSGLSRISRSVAGLPDEQSNGYLFTPSADDVQANPGNYWQAYYLKYDFDPDVFSYNIPGSNNKFVFKKDMTVFETPLSDNQIAFTLNQGLTPTFKITDVNGITYFFEQTERITIDGPNTYQQYINSWLLTRIVDQNLADTVYFTYEALCSGESEGTRNDVFSIGWSPSVMDVNGNPTPTNIPFQSNTSSITSTGHDNEYFIKQIDWRGGRITFTNTCDRLDRHGEKRLQGFDIYSRVQETLKEIKKVGLFQSYFFYNSTLGVPNPFANNDERNYRLRLDSVLFYSIDGADAPQVYRMTYNTSSMASRESCGQDLWGFNNGQFSNQSLMPIQTVQYMGANYNIGNANRNPDPVAMLACSISSIQYPTGGKSAFELEPHQYLYGGTVTQTNSTSCGAISNTAPTFSNSFTASSDMRNLRYSVSISAFTFSGTISPPVVTMTDQTTGQQVLQVVSPSGSQNYTTGTLYFNTPGNPTITSGHVYVLSASVYNNTGLVQGAAVYANIIISWEQTYIQNDVRIGGGLRVKSITHYDENGNIAGKEQYKYGVGESGFGQLMTPAIFTSVHSVSFTQRIGFATGGSFCSYATGPTCMSYMSNSSLPISQLAGSPVLYESVAKYQVSAAGVSGNGKTAYRYYLYRDDPVFTGTFDLNGVTLLSNIWKNGFLTGEDLYKQTGDASYSLVQSKQYNYSVDRSIYFNTVKVQERYIHTGCEYQGPSWVVSDFNFTYYGIPSAAMRMHSQSTTSYDENYNPHTVVENYYFGNNQYLFPTQRELITSKNESNMQTFSYAPDLSAAGNVYAKMVGRNILAPVVRVKLQKNAAVTTTNSNFYDWNGNNSLLLPQTIDQATAGHDPEVRILFNNYDQYGNILQQQKDKDFYQSYVWDYNAVYPVAAAINARASDVAYTSFEADGTGNWTIGATLRTTPGFTGGQAYNLSNGNVSKTGLDAGRTYVVTYWSQSGSALVNGASSTSLISRNGWNFFRQTLPAGATSVAISGSVTIDQLKLYPLDGQLTTATYQPLVGITSQGDADDKVTYYEYDGFGRLKLVRDDKGNIIKTLQYNFKK